MGEFGAVAVISGNIIGQTQTLTLFVESAYKVGCWSSCYARVRPCACCPGTQACRTGMQDVHDLLSRRGCPAPASVPSCPLTYPALHHPAGLQEYNSEAAFAAAVLLSFLALFTLLVS